MKKSLFSAVFFCLCSSFIFAQNIVAQKSLVNKINQEQRKEELAIKEATIAREDALQEKNAMTNGLSPILKYPEKQAPKVEQASQNLPEAINSKTEVQEVKPEDKSEAKPEEKQNVKTNKENPDPQGVDWIALSNGKLNVKMQRRTNGISTPNLSMKFNNVYQSLFRNIPWLMGGRARVYVYQNRKNFLDHEPVASDWSGAFFSPENNRIVMYDEPDNNKKMLSQFQHELTHLFLENYYSPKGSNKPEPPVWLNEGLAVNMEDITNNASGGVWAHDLVVMNFIPAPKSPAADLKAPRPITNVDVQFIKFTDFIKNDSYDNAVAAGKVQDWYMQAYAMVRFLFKPYNNQYPEKRIQFEQFTKLLNTYQNKRNEKGRLLKDEQGRQIKARLSVAAALKKAYGYNNIDDFELKFWQWLYQYQTNQRAKLNN
ncbi:MAG: hypothetical protein IKP23_05825 [Elusimicrobiaceae bacterium]|nr:hypothetical protein [Elusimicrobiaceae bacterium]